MENMIRKILQDNPAGLGKKDIEKRSEIGGKRLQPVIDSMIRKKEVIPYSGRFVLNNPNCVKACLLDVIMHSINETCDRIGMSKQGITNRKMKAWIDAYVDNMDWKDGKLISKIKKDICELSDMHNIQEILAE